MIFLDANFFINLYVKGNENHKRAKEILNSIKDEELLTSKLVIMEVITVLNIKLKKDPKLISNVYKELNTDYKVIIDSSFYDKGFKILIKKFNKNKKRISLFGSVYMALMEDLGIETIASFDKHFDLNENIKRIY